MFYHSTQTPPPPSSPLLYSQEDKEFVKQSTEAELIQLFRVYDELCEQRQELENKLDEAEDTSLP